MSAVTPIEWIQLPPSGPGRRRRSPKLLLVGARFKRSWLEQSRIETSDIYLEGPLGQALSDLLLAARDGTAVQGFALPIARLRASLLAQCPGLIALDRDVGVARPGQPRRAALSVYRWTDQADGGSSLPERVSSCIRRWCHDALDGWAERHASAALAQRVLEAAKADNIQVMPSERPLITTAGGKSRFDFSLMVRQVADRLVGEELFEGLGPCELVIDACGRDPGRSNSLELMTAPRLLNGREESFSMVARLTAVTIPYSQDVLLRISASKRTWAPQVPGPKRNAPFGVRAYVIGPGRAIFTVSVARSAPEGWQLGDEYAEWQHVAAGKLPSSLAEAVTARTPTSEGWWTGLPLLTTLFDAVPQRTVFEGDEIELHERIVKLLPDLLHADIPFRELVLPRRRSKSEVAMLRLSDFGVAGQALEEPDADDETLDDDLDEADETAEQKRLVTLERQRERNIRALRAIHRDQQPTLWSFCSSEEERGLIKKSVEQLFGDAVDLRLELLPANTHDLRDRLPGKTLNARDRFDLRVDAWKSAAQTVNAGPAPRYVLICASDRDGGRMEDPVNYYAGLHAMCLLADANVHHVLPIGAGEAERAKQHFVHRLQSALLDVFFAHSGVVFGTAEFLSSLLGDRTPVYIYGIQAARSQARAYSGEMNVSFLVFTRLHVVRGTTDVRFVYREKRTTKRTEWMALNQGLRWLGSQRALASDEVWLRESTTREVRDLLGELNEKDPRAIVLIDWSTLGGLWKGLSDEELTNSGVARIDGKDIAAACPKMTLVRVRRGEFSIALRAQTTSMYQRAGQGQEFVIAGAANEVYTEVYATTTKAVVALGSTSSPARSNHYIQSMGYRNTVQILRGQSCFRPKHRMRKRKEQPRVFELGMLEPSSVDAALPAPLEVTVMTSPGDVNADDVAIAVLGLRLGYVHYPDWTALPAPLFFKRKIDDYVVRYRSPATSGGGDANEEDIAPPVLTPADDATETEPLEPATSGSDGGASTTSSGSEYLLQSVREVVEENSTASVPPSDVATARHDVPVEVERSAHSTSTQVSDRELAAATEANDLDDSQLLDLMKRIATEDFALHGRQADSSRRQLYKSMIRGKPRVQVSAPYFVTPEGFFGNRPPRDKEALRRFWREQENIKWVGANESMPSLAKLSGWMFRRLQIPQGAYSVWSPALFPTSPVFCALGDGWERYVAERRATAAPGDADLEEVSETSLRWELLTQWAVHRHDDDLIGWLVFGCAHFPYIDTVLTKVLFNLTAPFGEATREACRYFLQSVRATRAVISGMAKAIPGGLHYGARPRPTAVATAIEQVQGGSGKVEVAGAEEIVLDQLPTSAAAPETAPNTAELAAHVVVAPCAAESSDTTRAALELLQKLVPGTEEFASSLVELRKFLESLEQLHHATLHAQQAAAREEAERTEAADRARAQQIARWSTLRANAVQLFAETCAALPDMQTLRAEPISEPPSSLESAERDLQELRAQTEVAKRAQDEYESVYARATPGNLTPREAARHLAQWQDALRAAHEVLETSLAALSARFSSSSLYRVGSQESAADAGHVSAAVAESKAEPAASSTASQVSATPPLLDSTTAADSEACTHPAQMAMPAAVDPAPVLGGSLDSASVADRWEPGALALTEDLDERLEAQPMASPRSAQVLLGLLRSRAYAAAGVYVQALQLDPGTDSIRDHLLVAAAAIESIRKLRSDATHEEQACETLRQGMQERTLQMSGCDSLAASIGILAAGLHDMLFPANAASSRWIYIDYLQPRLADNPGLSAFLRRIGSLEGIYLAQEMLTAASIGARDAALNTIAGMRERAKKWYADDALYRKWTANDYRNLHDALFKNEAYPIARCLGLIANGNDEELVDAYREARKRFAKPLATIEDLAKRIGRRRPFDGVARDHITGNMERTQKFVEEYMEAVQRARGLQAPVAANARTMLQMLYDDLTEALSAITELKFEAVTERMYRELALTALNELRRMFDCAKPVTTLSEEEQMLLLRLPLGIDLRPSLAPQTDSSGIALPAVLDPITVVEEVESLERRLSDAGEESLSATWLKGQLERACDDHLAMSRLLPARVIDHRLGRSASRHSEHARSLAALEATLQHERQRVTHAMALGAVTQGEASRMLRLIEELMLAGKSLGDPNLAPVATPDFPHAADALRRRVTLPLEKRLAESKELFYGELDAYFAENSSIPTLQIEIDRIRALASEGSASSIRAARDMFSLLKEGSLPKKASAPTSIAADLYTDFIRDIRDTTSRHRPLVECVQRKLLESSDAEEPSWLARLDSEARGEAASILSTWENLCAAKTPEEFEKHLTAFFKSVLPIEPTVVMQSPVNHLHRAEFFLNSLAGLDRTATGVFIPPALGSGAQYIQGIVIRRTAPDTAITQAIDERGQSAPTFLLARADWSLDKRASLNRYHPVLLVDDNLVVYAALHPEERFRRLMEVALLTFSGNPYDDYGRPVPPEMFFGRRPELRTLRNVKTAAVLYGGRRLGKSSLLDQLQRDAKGNPGETVIYLTFDRADRGVSEDHVFLAWNAIYRRLVQEQILQKPKQEITAANALRRWIEDEILAGRCKAKALYLLIDEADEVMGRDLHERGPFISGLQSLCESVRAKCAVRFVIAGLHNLTRMANDENSPLGKFDSIALKPFWSGEDIQRGVELIKVPLEALGFYFAPGKEDMPLRIMAVCNFYPAFIQLYCKRLVEHLYNRREKNKPPTYITEADLDKVELDKDFLSDIRSKFKLNLDLDKRYAAISLILADQYYSDGAKALTTSEVRNLCDLFAGRHFESTGPGAYESLLEEMETLTILERVGAKYRLRTPNIAMMLGDRESVGQQLETLGAETPVPARSRGEHRSVVTSVNGSKEQHSFPMPSAWVRQTFASAAGKQASLGEMDSELLVFVGNELSGLPEIARLKGEWQIGETATFDVNFYASAQAARSTLVRSARALANRSVQARRMHCVASGWTVSQIGDYARLAATLAAASVPTSGDTNASAVTRLALIANPGRAYELAKLLQSSPEAERNWRVVPVPPWTDDALYFWLERMEKPDIYNNAEARRAILKASCGFGGEVEKLCSRLDLDGAHRAPERAATALAPDTATFYRKIGLPAAVDVGELKRAEELLKVLDGETRQADVTEEYRHAGSVSAELFLLLQWMGLLQEAPGGTWQVPELYKRLIS